MAASCRLCRETDVFNNIFELLSIVDYKDYKTTCADAILYCLDIQICQDSNITTMICLECYNKLISFFKFKVTATESNDILTSKENNVKSGNDNCVKNELNQNFSGIKLYKDVDVQKPKETPSAAVHGRANKCQPRRSARFKKMQDTCKPKTKLKSCANKQLAVIREKVVQANSSVGKKQMPRAVQPKKLRKCPDCGKSVLEAWLKSHMQTHSANRIWYPCDMCDKKYSTKTAMTKHKDFNHLGQVPICPICNKGFHQLSLHIATSHRSESTRPHACAHCPRRFTTPAALRTHEFKHTGARPWLCGECGKAFQLKGILIKHKRQIHDKERSHVCHVCAKTFFQQYALQRHLTSHSRERACADCGVRTRTDAALRRHRLQAHSGSKPFCCELCERGFSTHKTLRRHVKQHIEPHMNRKSDVNSCTKQSKQEDDEEDSVNYNGITFLDTSSNQEFDCDDEEYLSTN